MKSSGHVDEEIWIVPRILPRIELKDSQSTEICCSRNCTGDSAMIVQLSLRVPFERTQAQLAKIPLLRKS